MSAAPHLLARLRRRLDMAWMHARARQLETTIRDMEQRIRDDHDALTVARIQHATLSMRLNHARNHSGPIVPNWMRKP